MTKINNDVEILEYDTRRLPGVKCSQKVGKALKEYKRQREMMRIIDWD